MGFPNNKLTQLQYTFPKLTEKNQQYMLGVAKSLKHAQENRAKKRLKNLKNDAGKTGG